MGLVLLLITSVKVKTGDAYQSTYLRMETLPKKRLEKYDNYTQMPLSIITYLKAELLFKTSSYKLKRFTLI